MTGELGVVRVMSNDVLNLREAPSPEASVVMTLAHEQRAVVPTGAACVGKESAWLEVAVLGRAGWVNAQFVDYVTGPRDVTQQFEALLAGRRFLSTEALFNAVAKAVREQGKGSGPSDPDVTVLGKQVSATSANMLLENCCFGDDSIRGQQLEVMTERGENGDWTLSSVRSRQLCYRGVSDDLCL
ncbi:SH3 domain-containing protein [Sorangium sp. So ce260]|uniref:hypothetical protein n=1 Tax=Sorangium sp. So ce260 TaxID=3133291 RepID=UPI003F5EBDA1